MKVNGETFLNEHTFFLLIKSRNFSYTGWQNADDLQGKTLLMLKIIAYNDKILRLNVPFICLFAPMELLIF